MPYLGINTKFKHILINILKKFKKNNSLVLFSTIKYWDIAKPIDVAIPDQTYILKEDKAPIYSIPNKNCIKNFEKIKIRSDINNDKKNNKEYNLLNRLL